MNWNLCLSICFMQILLYTHAMEKDDVIHFSLSIRLPFSVKRGEVVNVPVSVYNCVNYKINVAITLHNSNREYEVMDFDNKVINEPRVTKSINLEDHSAGKISFLIRPIVIGNVTLTFKAYTSSDFDTVNATLNVLPEGITQYGNHALLVNLKNQTEQKSAFALELPEYVVPDSQQFELGAVGDIVGLVLKNLGNLVRMPTGPAEQTMSSLLPNYLLMKYLKNSYRLIPDIKAKLRHNLETGYQKILNCRNMDGSFSSFGHSREKYSSSGSSLTEEEPFPGSTFMTAYVLRFLPHFKEFININEKVIEEGLAFLSKQQAGNGAFTENGNYLYPSQGNDVTLSGAAILAFLENQAYADKYLQNITKALEFIGNNVEKFKSLHIQTLATYDLKQDKHASSEKTNLIKWLSETSIDNQSKWWHYVYLSNVEITSYNLLTLLKLKFTKIDYTLPAVRRIIAQRKSLGGFSSTQDTIVGLIDIINIADFSDYELAEMDVNILSKGDVKTIKLTEDNGILYKSIELPPETKSLRLAANGTGSALVQIAFQYNTFKDQEDHKPSFNIKTIRLDNQSTPSHFTMIVCVNFVGKGESSNIAMLEIYIPSGYAIDDENIKEIQQLKRVINTELKNSGSLLVIYFDRVYKQFSTCLTVKALRTHDVAMHKPVPIIMCEYSNKDRRTVDFYDIESKLCDICSTWQECHKCKKQH